MLQALQEGLEQVWLDADRLRAHFCFPSSGLPLFAGHFPERPLVPGVLELAAVRYALDRASGREHRLEEVVDARFNLPVVPDTRLEIDAQLLTRADGGLRVRARLRCQGVEVGRSTLHLRPESPA